MDMAQPGIGIAMEHGSATRVIHSQWFAPSAWDLDPGSTPSSQLTTIMTPTNLPARSEPSPGESTHLAGYDAHSPRTHADFPAEEEQGVNWRRYLAAVVRHKWLVLFLVIGGTAAGVGLTQLVRPVYRAQSTVWVETGQGGDMGPIRSGELLRPDAWPELLRSQAVLEPVVIGQRLYLQADSPTDSMVLSSLRIAPNVQPGAYRLAVGEAGQTLVFMTQDGTVLQRGRVGEPVGREIGLSWTPPAEALDPGDEIDFAVQTPSGAAAQLAQQVEVGTAGTLNFLRIGLTGPDPHQVAATVNAVTEQFVTVAGELKRATLEARTAILDDQLQIAQTNLQGAESELESFRVQTITQPSEPATPVTPGLAATQDPVFSSFFNMRVQQQQLRRDREALQRAMADAQQSELSVGALEIIPSVQTSSEFQQALTELAAKRASLRGLQYQYTTEHPAVQQAMEDIQTLERQTIPRLANSLLANINTRLGAIDTRLASASSELREIPTRTIEEQRRVRERQSAENLYTELLNRYESSRLAAASTVPDVSVLDEANVPRSPTNEGGRAQLILIGLLGGLGLGVLGSILLDRVDPRLRYPEQVTGELGLNILGAIPHVGPNESRPGREGGEQVVEAFREIRLNVMHAFGSAGPLMVTITSPGIGDGKSFVSSNLALAFADQGYRTLLIDGDIRRGGLHRLFDRDRKRGLTDYLAGKASREEVVRKTSYPTLDLLPCGTRMKGGPELLGSPAMSRLLVEMRSMYNVILIDSPPLGAGVDPFALGAASGNLMLVLRAGNTNRELAEAKLDLIDRLPIRVLGAVLNDVPSKGVYRYYSYLSGYESRDERLDDAEEARQLQSA